MTKYSPYTHETTGGQIGRPWRGSVSVDGHPLSAPETGAIAQMQEEIKKLRQAVEKLTQLLREKL